MKGIMIRIAATMLLSAFALASPVAWGQAGIQSSSHNFVGFGDPATGLCTFCHTPHQAQSQALLWNHTLSTANFNWTDTATTAGTVYPNFAGDTYQGATAKCLSCHDGSVAVGDIGWWDAQDPGDLSGGWFVNYDPVQIGPSGLMDSNHPVAMPMPFNNAPSTYNGSTNGAAIAVDEWQADPQTLGIRLYSDDGTGSITGGATPGQTGIECSSCHDPHNGTEVQDDYLLRGIIGGATADYICLKCHIK